MEISDETIIDKLLARCAEIYPAQPYTSNFIGSLTGDKDNAWKIADRIEARMDYEGLADKLDGDRVMITARGQEIVRAGGYLIYLETQAQHSLKESEIKEIEVEIKRKSLSKFKYDKIAFGIAIASFIVTVVFSSINLYNQKSAATKQQELEDRIKQLELNSQVLPLPKN